MAKRRKAKSTSRRFTLPSLRFRFDLIRSINWAMVRQGAVGAAWLTIIAAAVAAWIVGVPRLQAQAVNRAAVAPAAVSITFVSAPPWMRGDLADMLTRTASLQVRGNPLERADLVAVRSALLKTGWFDSVDQVRRVDADYVEIAAKFVIPYTVIRDEDGDHLVDYTGKLLPRSYPRGARTNFIAISGVHFDRPQRAGMIWEGADVIAGIRLLQLIDRQTWRDQVAEIDVAGCLNDGPIRLRTDRGTTIVWGGAPGEEPALEVLAEGKIKRLDYLFKHYQRIDGGHPGEVDITGEKGVFTR